MSLLGSINSMLQKSMFLLSTTAENVTADEAQAIVDEAAAGSSVPVSLLALCGVLGVICVVLVVIILLQKKRASGIGAAISGSGETYWSKNKGKSSEGALEKYTKLGGAAFLLIALVINMIM